MFRVTAVALLLILAAACAFQNASPASLGSAEFMEFLSSRRQHLPAPSSAQVERGREVFLSGPCVMCHTVRGTIALATVGPDLTHLAERTTLAAGTLPNTRGHLAGWILNPQNLKPGTRMPPTLLPPEDLHALLAFLETLK